MFHETVDMHFDSG
jgi:hypothetical protein